MCANLKRRIKVLGDTQILVSCNWNLFMVILLNDNAIKCQNVCAC